MHIFFHKLLRSGGEEADNYAEVFLIAFVSCWHISDMKAESLEKKIAALFAYLLEVIFLLTSGSWLTNMENNNDPSV